MAQRESHLCTVINDDGAAILDLRQGTLSTLNPTGAYVWEALRRGESAEAIVNALAEKTGESRDLIDSDVREFLSSLQAHHLM